MSALGGSADTYILLHLVVREKMISLSFSFDDPPAQALGAEPYDHRPAILGAGQNDVRKLSTSRPGHQGAALDCQNLGGFVGGQEGSLDLVGGS